MTRKAVSGEQAAGQYDPVNSSNCFISGVYRMCAMLTFICLGFLKPSPAPANDRLPQPNPSYAAATLVKAFAKVSLGFEVGSAANPSMAVAGAGLGLLVPAAGKRSRKQRGFLLALAVTLLFAATLGFSG